jgi:hypothetical protein
MAHFDSMSDSNSDDNYSCSHSDDNDSEEYQSQVPVFGLHKYKSLDVENIKLEPCKGSLYWAIKDGSYFAHKFSLPLYNFEQLHSTRVLCSDYEPVKPENTNSHLHLNYDDNQFKLYEPYDSAYMNLLYEDPNDNNQSNTESSDNEWQ